MTTGIDGQLSLYDLLGSPEPVVVADPEPVVIAEPELAADSVPGTGFVIVSETEADDEEPPDLTPPPFEVVVTRSKRRRKTAEAQMVESVLQIRIPAASSAEEEQHFVDHFRSKFERRRAAAVVDLEKRSKELAKEYGLPTPDSIRWVSNQKQQWGSCTPSESSIRLSDRMAGFPGWVVDYVIVHELAHLVHLEHSEAFWDLVNAYPKTERARGYLLAKDGV